MKSHIHRDELYKACNEILGSSRADGADMFKALDAVSGFSWPSTASYDKKPWIDEGEITDSSAYVACGTDYSTPETGKDVKLKFFKTTNTQGIADAKALWVKDGYKDVWTVDAPNGITVLTQAKPDNRNKAEAWLKVVGQKVSPS